jgi:hypothetical protein
MHGRLNLWALHREDIPGKDVIDQHCMINRLRGKPGWTNNFLSRRNLKIL